MIKRRQFFTFTTLLLLATPAFAADDFWASTTTLPTEFKYSYNWWQPMVGAKTAYTTGMRGAKVTVGLLDTGLNTANLEFKGRIAPGYNAIANNSKILDDNGHGTHVAGILGAAADNGLMVGIAPEVTLLPIKVLNASGQGTFTALTAGMRYAASHGARIVNLSLGGGSPVGQQTFQSAVAAGQLLVIAAGNDSSPNPDFPAQFAKETWSKNQIIAVGAVDSKGVLASFSNRAGNTASHYVVAPGTNIVSTYGANQYAYMSGTSMATPVVSGVAADILSRWSYLKADQVASIIFQTATHKGKSAVTVPDSIYGWGLVNLTKALQPIGNPQVAGGNGGSQSLAKSALTTNSLITAKAFSGVTLTATDDFGRAYGYDLGQLVSEPAAASLSTLFGAMDKQMALLTRSSATASLTIALYGTAPEMMAVDSPFFVADAPGVTVGGLSFVQRYGGGEYAVGANGFADQYFGLTADYAGVPLGTNFANPYLRLAGTASHLALGYTFGAGYSVKVGVLNDTNPLASQPLLESAAGADGWLGEVEKRFADGVVRVAVGALKENESVLGASGSGALALAGARTQFVSLSGAYELSGKDALLAQMSMGSTVMDGWGVIGDGEARTMGWSLGFLHQDGFLKGDKLVFSLSQPLRVESGSMTVVLPTVDDYGVGAWSSRAVDLTSGSPETDFEVGYMAPLSKNSSVTCNAAYKKNVANSDGDAAVVGVRFNWKF